MSKSPGAGRVESSSLPELSVIDCSAAPEARKITTSPPLPPTRKVSLGARWIVCMRRASARRTPSDSSANTDDISRIRTRGCRTDGRSAPSPSLGCQYSLSSKPPPELDLRRTTRRTIRPEAPRTRLASKIERVLSAALGGDQRVVLNVKASEVLAEPEPVAQVISAAL